MITSTCSCFIMIQEQCSRSLCDMRSGEQLLESSSMSNSSSSMPPSRTQSWTKSSSTAKTRRAAFIRRPVSLRECVLVYVPVWVWVWIQAECTGRECASTYPNTLLVSVVVDEKRGYWAMLIACKMRCDHTFCVLMLHLSLSLSLSLHTHTHSQLMLSSLVRWCLALCLWKQLETQSKSTTSGMHLLNTQYTYMYM